MNNRIIRLLVSFLAAVALMVVLCVLTPEQNPPRILVLLGGVLPGGLIQGFTYFLFFFGMSEVFHTSKRLTYEADAFTAKLLPEEENWILSEEDVNQLKLNMQKMERSQKFLLTDLIKKACTKYRLGKSSSEVLGLVDSQINIYKSKIDGEQSFMRYTAWAIPSVGFIGTVLGIAGALGYADQAGSTEGLKLVTDMLGVAFDTTLVALFLSIILVFSMHFLEKKEEDLFSDMSSYMNENLINRFYK